jgi:serine protease Do
VHLQKPRILVTALAACLLCLQSADAQRLAADRFKNGSGIRRLLQSATRSAQRCVVRVTSDGKDVALGTIVGPDGAVLTKASELSGQIACRLPDGQTVPAKLIGVHTDLDLAMLSTTIVDRPQLAWQTSAPGVGSFVATPGLKELPIAVGIISTPLRSIPAQRGVLGISVSEFKGGPRVTEVFPNSGADRGGIAVDDVLQRINGQRIATRDALKNIISQAQPGDRLSIEVLRGGRTVKLSATLGYRTASLFNRGNFQNQLGGILSRRRGGFEDILQHDSVVKRSQCGGPLVDLQGQVVGINIARAGRTETYALGARQILAILDDLRSGKLAPVVPDRPSGPAPPPLPVPPR